MLLFYRAMWWEIKIWRTNHDFLVLVGANLQLLDLIHLPDAPKPNSGDTLKTFHAHFLMNILHFEQGL